MIMSRQGTQAVRVIFLSGSSGTLMCDVYGDIPTDNSASERSIRPFTIAGEYFVLIDTVEGAKASAIVFRIVETAKANGFKVYEYLKYLLSEVPKHMDQSDLSFIDNLLPWSESLPNSCK